MTRYHLLSVGGFVEIPCSERCPDCGTHPKNVSTVDIEKIEISREVSVDKCNFCSKCLNRWDVVLQ